MAQRSGGTLYSFESGEKITPETKSALQSSVERHPAYRPAAPEVVESIANIPYSDFTDPTTSPADSQFRLAPPTRTPETQD